MLIAVLVALAFLSVLVQDVAYFFLGHESVTGDAFHAYRRRRQRVYLYARVREESDRGQG